MASAYAECQEEVARRIGVGVPTLRDILENLEKPGLDPREALPAPILRHDVLSLDDLREGMGLVYRTLTPPPSVIYSNTFLGD